MEGTYRAFKNKKQARSLLALAQDVRITKEPILMKSLTRVGLVKEN